MPLVPVDDTGQRHLIPELLPGDLHACRTETDALSRIAYPQHRYPLASDVASLAEDLETVAPAVMPRDHTEARRATVHGVQLIIMVEKHFTCVILFVINFARAAEST